MLNTLGLANKVKLHLTYAVMWSNITTVSIDDICKATSTIDNHQIHNINPNRTTYILKGSNPKSGEMEYVLPISKRNKLTLENLDSVFQGIENAEDKEPGSVEKILMAIIDSDGSILFYYVNRGVKHVND